MGTLFPMKNRSRDAGMLEDAHRSVTLVLENRTAHLSWLVVLLLLGSIAIGSACPAFAMPLASRRDRTPPSVPTGLSAIVVSSSQISLSWTASTDPDNSQSQLTYGVYRNGSRVAVTAAGVTSFLNTGLAASTTYSYTVSAYDPAGNASSQSSAAQATTSSLKDTIPPTVPTNLSVAGVSSSTVSLVWVSSTDNVGVTGYSIYRAGVLIGTSSTASYTNSGLAPSTTYSYAVSAYDAAGNSSAQTTAVIATTAALVIQGPIVSITSPANNQTVSGVITVAASATDSLGIAGVQFQLDGTSLGAEVTTSPYSVSWNTATATSATHLLTAIARDSAGNRTTSSAVTVTVSSASQQPYSTTFPLTENPISEGGNWINGKANGIDWGDVQTTPGLAFGTNSGGYADSTALLSGNWGPNQMAQATVHSVNQTDSLYEEVELRLRSTISAHSNTGYEINFRCSKTANAYSQVVRWNGPLGNFTYLMSNGGAQYGVTNKDVVKATMIGNVITVYINGVQIGQVTDNTYTSGSPGMGFYLSGATGVNANYGFSNYLASDELTGDSTPPSVPTGLSATAISSSAVDLSWSASTDNVAVTGYEVFRNGTQIASTPNTSFADTTVGSGTQYSYAVAAFDAAGNVSAQSSPVVATTPSATDITTPSIPLNLKSSNITSTSVTVAWTASTDNVAIAGYRVFRNGSQVGTTATISYTDTGLSPSSTYVYTIEAYDGSNNASAQSQQLVVLTTPAPVTLPSLVQVNQNQISSGASTSVSLNAPTQVGNTIVAYVIWNNVGSVALSDSLGNAFVGIGSPLSWGNGYSAQVFYASNIAGGMDTVTAAFRNSVTAFGVVYAHEYAGISTTSPVDVTASATGSSASLNSSTAVTTSVNDLIFGAGVSDNVVTSAGSNFIARDLAYGNITEDRIAASTGSYSATATHNGSTWGIQMVAFRAAQ
jgi:chitodextrinase